MKNWRAALREISSLISTAAATCRGDWSMLNAQGRTAEFHNLLCIASQSVLFSDARRDSLESKLPELVEGCKVDVASRINLFWRANRNWWGGVGAIRGLTTFVGIASKILLRGTLLCVETSFMYVGWGSIDVPWGKETDHAASCVTIPRHVRRT